MAAGAGGQGKDEEQKDGGLKAAQKLRGMMQHLTHGWSWLLVDVVVFFLPRWDGMDGLACESVGSFKGVYDYEVWLRSSACDEARERQLGQTYSVQNCAHTLRCFKSPAQENRLNPEQREKSSKSSSAK